MMRRCRSDAGEPPRDSICVLQHRLARTDVEEEHLIPPRGRDRAEGSLPPKPGTPGTAGTRRRIIRFSQVNQRSPV